MPLKVICAYVWSPFVNFMKINALSHCVFFFSPGQVQVKMRLLKSSSASQLFEEDNGYPPGNACFKGSWEDDVPLP